MTTPVGPRPCNFSAGPAAKPAEAVLPRAGAEMPDWHGSGMDNATPLAGVQALMACMREFERLHA